MISCRSNLKFQLNYVERSWEKKNRKEKNYRELVLWKSAWVSMNSQSHIGFFSCFTLWYESKDERKKQNIVSQTNQYAIQTSEWYIQIRLSLPLSLMYRADIWRMQISFCWSWYWWDFSASSKPYLHSQYPILLILSLVWWKF